MEREFGEAELGDLHTVKHPTNPVQLHNTCYTVEDGTL